MSIVFLSVASVLSIANPGAAFGRFSFAVVFTGVAYIPDALGVIREERQRTVDEQEAFAGFSRRLANVDTAEPRPRVAATGRGVATTTADASNLDAVYDAYRGTVMAVPHYEEEYDEALLENMAGEFGTDVAAAVAEAETLTPPLKRALLGASDRSRRKRASFVRTLDRELDTLNDADETITAVYEGVKRLVRRSVDRQSFDDAVRAEERLEEYERECRRLLVDRQNQLHQGNTSRRMNVQRYLYASQAWTYPVLNESLECLDRIRDVQRRVVRTITRRP